LARLLSLAYLSKAEILQANTMEQRVFAFSLIIEGTSEKVLQFIVSLKSIYNRNFGFTQQKNVFLSTTESFKQEKLY